MKILLKLLAIIFLVRYSYTYYLFIQRIPETTIYYKEFKTYNEAYRWSHHLNKPHIVGDDYLTDDANIPIDATFIGIYRLIEVK